MRRIKLLSVILLFATIFAACGQNTAEYIAKDTAIVSEKDGITETKILGDTLDEIPQYDGNTFAVVNGNQPYFNEEDLVEYSYEKYSKLDHLGRCGMCMASVGQDIMPKQKRGEIGSVKPSGWHTVKYNNVDGKYLYNRCHLIGYQLTGENANEKNLITGTRYLNVEGMLPFENMVADYVKESANHVIYRVTPIYEDDNLLASGVLMEGFSVEDNGQGICFNVYCYNVQPGIEINYATGDSSLAKKIAINESTANKSDKSKSESGKNTEYVLNTNTKKFHKTACHSVKQMNVSNVAKFKGDRQDLIDEGYEPCKSCKP